MQNEMQKNILLERFQEENPGFDFSGAEVNGMVPDPRNFMGGVKYNWNIWKIMFKYFKYLNNLLLINY